MDCDKCEHRMMLVDIKHVVGFMTYLNQYSKDHYITTKTYKCFKCGNIVEKTEW